MNAERRKQIAALTSKANELQNLRDELVAELESIRDDEQGYYDNMPESFQNGDKGERAQTAVNALEEALGALGFDDITEYLDTAAE